MALTPIEMNGNIALTKRCFDPAVAYSVMPSNEFDTATVVLALKEEATHQLRERCLPVNSLLWVCIARPVRRIVPSEAISSLLSMLVVASVPLALALLLERVSNQDLSKALISPAEGSILMFIALFMVDMGYRRWLRDFGDVANLYIDEVDTRRAMKVMLGSLYLRFQLSGTTGLFSLG